MLETAKYPSPELDDYSIAASKEVEDLYQEMYCTARILFASTTGGHVDALDAETLEFRFNDKLSGTLPASWGGMDSLEFVSFVPSQDAQLLSGTLPSEWGGMTKLSAYSV
mgnify:CR=1 FL=1